MSDKATILSTRSLSPDWLEEAERQGSHLKAIPFIQIKPILSDEIDAQIAEALPSIAFTSANAVRFFGNRLTEIEHKPEIKQIFCLQGETMREVMRLNLDVAMLAARNARELAELIISQKNLQGVSFFCGNRRRNDLPEVLKQHNLKLHEVQLYQTQIYPRPVDFVYDAVLFFSPSAAEAFFQTNILRSAVPCICIGETTAAAVRGFTANPVLVAEKHETRAVLDKAMQCLQESDSINKVPNKLNQNSKNK
jgi:uroporphyrinogen-III synthase